MDPLDVTILALRIGLVAVLYGFLLVVLRSAGQSLQTAQAPTATRPSRRLDLRLTVLAAAGTGLTVGQAVDVGEELTLGRAAAVGLVLADATVSAEHARVARVGRDWVVRDLGSTNGTLVNGSRVNGQTMLQDGDILALGGVQLKVTIRASSSVAQG